jgi:hypothetical protein
MRYEGTGTGARLFKARTEVLYHARVIGQRFMFARAMLGRFRCRPGT